MTTAYEIALVTLRLKNRADPLTALIARKIIEVVQRGHKDVEFICATALDDLGLKPKSSGPELASPQKPTSRPKGQRTGDEATPDQALLLFAPLMEQMPCAIGVMDLTGKWILANSIMRRYIPEKIPSRDIARVELWRAFDGDGRPVEPVDWPGARALRGDTCGLSFVYSENGRELPTHVAASPFLDAQGQLIGAIAMVHNIC